MQKKTVGNRCGEIKTRRHQERATYRKEEKRRGEGGRRPSIGEKTKTKRASEVDRTSGGEKKLGENKNAREARKKKSKARRLAETDERA